MLDKRQLSAVEEALRHSDRIVEQLRKSGILETVERFEKQLSASFLQHRQFQEAVRLLAEIDTRTRNELAQIASRFEFAQRQFLPSQEIIPALQNHLQSAQWAVVPDTSAFVPPLPKSNAVQHLSRQLDQEQTENAALQDKVKYLESLVRYYESRNPSDLPDHDVNGLYGSPS